MLEIGEYKLTPLDGGVTQMDGGATFGVVPKPLWSKKYPFNDNNQVPLICYPVLIQSEYGNFLIDAGTGNGKVTEKERRNFGISYESNIDAELARLGLSTDDIDIVLMSHMHFDHALGLTTHDAQPVFKNARIITSEIEWQEMQHPNIRSKATYWQKNYHGIEDKVETFRYDIDVSPGIKMIHTGGHSDGHAIIVIESRGQTAVHMADLLPTAAHINPLWVTAYDDYPMDSIRMKEKYLTEFKAKDAWFTFYHDSRYFAVKFDDRDIKETLERGQIDV